MPQFPRRGWARALVSHVTPSVHPPPPPAWPCDSLDPRGTVSAVKVCGLLLEKTACLVLGSFCPSAPGPGLRGKLCGLDNTRGSVEDVALCLRSVFTAQLGGIFERVHPPSHSLPLSLEDNFIFPVPRSKNVVTVLTTLFLLSANPTGFPFRTCPGRDTPTLPTPGVSPSDRCRKLLFFSLLPNRPLRSQTFAQGPQRSF